jgi:hypothetical protein
MATDLDVAEPVPPPHWDPDAAKFYEVVDGRVVENPPMGARGPGDELEGGAIIHGFRVGLATLFEDVDDDLGATDQEPCDDAL